MNRLLVALCASAFAFGSASALAGDIHKAALQMDTQEAKAARDAAKVKWAKMTPEEQAAVKKAAAAKNHESWNALEESSSGIDYNAKKGAAAAAASKAGPAPAKGTMNTPEMEKALKKQKGQ